MGEVFEVDDAGITILDRLEGTHLPGGYRRVRLAVTGEDSPAALDTWSYVKDRSSIEEIHGEPMEEYRLDPRYVTADRRRHYNIV